jgi:hypothetical protein
MGTHAISPELPKRRADDAHLKIGNPMHKFIIGFVAGFSAAIFPRLTALLLMAGADSGLEIISAGYLLISVLFAVMIGAVVTIMEWGVLREPHSTFMTALGIPAIITGSFNAVDGARQLELQSNTNSALTTQLEQMLDIRVMPSDASSIQPISINDNRPQAPATGMSFSLIPAAHAADFEIKEQPRFRVNPSIQAQENRYVVVLDKRPTRSAAIARANELNSKLPAQAVISDHGYLIIYRKSPTSRSEAVLDAAQIQQKYELATEILELQ